MRSSVRYVSAQIHVLTFFFSLQKVSVECKERGELLSKLRDRYSSLLSRVPRQIKRSVFAFIIEENPIIICSLVYTKN